MSQKLPVCRDQYEPEEGKVHEIQEKKEKPSEIEAEEAHIEASETEFEEKDGENQVQPFEHTIDSHTARESKTDSSSSGEEQEEGELEEIEEEESIGDEQEENEEEDDGVALIRVSRQDHEPHPKKRIALESEGQRNLHRGRRSQREKRQSSPSDDDEDYASDEVEDDNDRNLEQRRRHSRRGSKEDEDEDQLCDLEDLLKDIKESQNPSKSISKLTEIVKLIMREHESLSSIDALIREWLPKYATVILNRSYPDLGYPQSNAVVTTVCNFLNKFLEVTICLLEEPQKMGVKKGTFPLSEAFQDAVYRILGDESASFYRKFDGRGDSGRRLDIIEYDDNNNELMAMEQLEPRISQHQVRNIKSFVANKGLQAVLRSLGHTENTNRHTVDAYYYANLDLKNINSMVKIVHKMAPFLSGLSVDFRDFSLNVATCVQERIKDIPDELFYHHDKKLLINTVHMVHHMIITSPSTTIIPTVIRDERSNYHPMASSDDEDEDDDDSEFLHYQEVPDEQQILSSCFLRLNVASRLLRGFRLDLRLTGLNEIKDLLSYGLKQAKLIKRTKRKNNLRKRSMSIESEDNSILIGEETTSEKILRLLVKKLREQEILEYIFGPNIHLEIVQRSTDVLLFLMHTGELTADDLDKIWIPVAGCQHRSIVHGVFQVLSDISDQLSLEHRENLFRKLKDLPMNFYETQTYLLIKQLILSMVENAQRLINIGEALAVNEVSYEAHLLLWRILRDSSVPISSLMNTEVVTPTAASAGSTSTFIDQDIIKGVSQLLNTILHFGPAGEKRQELLQKCIDDLKAHHPATVWALSVIMKIISPSLSAAYSTTDYLHYLVDQVGLPDLFLEDLKYWTNAVKSFSDRRTPTSNMEVDRMSPPIGPPQITAGLSPFRGAILKDQLLGRLQFLQWMANSESVPFFTSTAQTDIIWDCLVADPIGISERDSTFAHLDNIAEYEHFTYHFFHNRLPQLDARHFTEQAFKYVKNSFQRVNEKSGRLRIIHPSQTILLQGDLIGAELIWKIALCAEEEAVGKEAIAFLVHLYMNTDPNLYDSVALARKHRETLVDKCVAHLFAAANGLSSSLSFSKSDSEELQKDSFVSTNEKAVDVLMFKRCLDTLKYFMDCFDTKYLLSKTGQMLIRRHGMLNDGKMITIKVKLTHGADTKEMEFPMHTSETILALRHKISAKINLSQPGVIRLITGGKEYHPELNGLTFQELKINDGAVFIGQRRLTEGRDSQEADKSEISGSREIKDADLPANILSKYVDQFFIMLQLEEEYASQIWDFLMRLPTNTRILNALKALEAPVQWNALLDNQSPFRLLYSLQIVDWLLRGGDDTPSASDWNQKFLDNGGHDHLFSVLTNRNHSALHEHQKSVIKRACLGLLLKVIDFFAADDSRASGEFFKLIDRNDLIMKLLEIVGKCIDPSIKQVDEDIMIIKYANKLLYYLCMSDDSALQSLFEYSGFSDWLLTALVRCQSEEARKEIANMIQSFCGISDTDLEIDGFPEPHLRSFDFFLRLLVSLLPELELHVFTSKEYFDLLGYLLNNVTTTINFDIGQFFMQLIQHVRQHPITEEGYVNELSNLGHDDTVIIGLLKLLKIIVQKYPQFKRPENLGDGFVNMIFFDCLFEIPTMEHSNASQVPPKCKLTESRSAAMELLSELVKDCPSNFVQLTSMLLQQLDRGDQLHDNWNYCPQTCTKAPSGYVGLQNLGATCYVNSIVQQFFMNPSFRNGIFLAPVRDENKDESLLYQLQVVFGHLQESKKRSYEATPFCLAYKDYDGQPMNVAVQMDVDEYFIGLFDRLESSVSGTSQAVLFKEHFGGILVDQIKSKECGHVSEKEESFFAIQCEVKNKKNVEESLQLYVEGDVLDGDNKYFCAKCGTHVDAIKRTCIKELPNNLILHLKRFHYDVETSKRVKINEHFEFPDRISMESYTLDYLTRKESGQLEEPNLDPLHKAQFEYELVGVLVHTGTADSGHYYSFIKERRPFKDSINERKWYQFNDSNVEEFNPKDIPKCCYGGSDTMTNWDPTTQKNVIRAFAKPYSAYMLFYERCGIASNENDLSQQTSNVSGDIYKVIWDENISFLQDKNIFDTGYFKLLSSILHTVDFAGDNQIIVNNMEIDLTLRTIHLAGEFVLGTLSRAKDNVELKDWVEFLKTLFQTHLKGCQWFISRFINKYSNYLQQHLMSCYVQDVREHIVDLVLFALKVLRQGDPIVYGLEMVDIELGEEHGSIMSVDSHLSEICRQDGLIAQLLNGLHSLLPNAYLWWRNFDQYFCILFHISSFGLAERIYMVQCGFIEELVKLFLLDEITPLRSRKRRMGDKFSMPPFRNLLLTLRQLLLICNVTPNADSQFDMGGSLPLKLGNDELHLILHQSETDEQYSFFMKQIREAIDPMASRDIFEHFAYKNRNLSEQFIQQLIHAADIYPVDHIKPHLEIVYHLVQIKDNYCTNRVNTAIREVLKLSKVNQNSPQVSVECLHFIDALCLTDVGPYVSQLLITHLDQWIPDFLLVNHSEIVRQRAEDLCNSLIFSKFEEAHDEIEKQEASNHIRRLYIELLKYIETAEGCWRSTVAHRREGFGWRLASYFRILTKCVRSPEDKLLFSEYFDKFANCFALVDSHRNDCDMDKKEMITFWYKVCEDCPENVELFVSNPSIYGQLHIYYVSINHSPENIVYNQSTLQKYYGLILMGCHQSSDYHTTWMEAANFLWALSSMIFGDFYDDHKTDELQELLKISADRSPKFRLKCWDNFLTSNNNTAHLSRRIPLYLRLHTFLYRETIEDLHIFCKHSGFDSLSQYISLVKDKNDENLFQYLDVLYCYFKIAASVTAEDEALRSYKEWATRRDFTYTLLGFLHPNTENQIYLRVTEILSIILKIETTRNIIVEVLQLLIDYHLEWQKKASRIDETELLFVFGGSRSLFHKYRLLPDAHLGQNTTKSPFGTLLIHVHRPFMSKLQVADIKCLEEELYGPYLTVVAHAITAGINFDEFDKVVRLSSLLALEMIEIQDNRMLNILLGIYEKYSDNNQVREAFGHSCFASLVEYVLNSNPHILGRFNKLSVFKELIEIVKSKRPDVITPIVSRNIQQLAADVKVLKEKLETNEVEAIRLCIQQLILVLHVLSLTLSDEDLSSFEDSLWQACNESLEDLEGKYVETQLSRFTDFSDIAGTLSTLVTGLRNRTGSHVINPVDVDSSGVSNMAKDTTTNEE